MAYIDTVRTALRITHTKLDTEITAAIDTAKAEMERTGIMADSIVETDAMISAAIKTYCKHVFASDVKMSEGYFNSWQYQIECLRKSTGYMVEVEEDV